VKVARVLVVGGGIGGLSAAIALRTKGFDVDVVELRPDLHSSVYGVGIIQPVNALRALDRIGCARACLDAGYSTRAWGKVLDADGNEVRQIPGATLPGSDLPPMNGVTRPVLHEILTAKANAEGASIRYSTTVRSLEHDAAAAYVEFDDGGQGTYDLVIGADGTYSRMRTYVVPDIKPTYNGQSAFRVNVPRRIPGQMEIDRIILQHNEDGMAGFVPIGPELAYMFYNSAWPEGTWLDPDTLDVVLRERLAGFGGLTGAVRDSWITDPAGIVFRPIEWMIAAPPWHAGRVVLIGDAVHAFLPHLGQGAAQAIEDGIVLAECLAEADQLEKALTAYTDRRYERCRMVIEACVQIGEWERGLRPGFDNVAVTQSVIETLLQPI